MNQAIRLSPSGPVIGGAATPYAPGPGARLRLTEAQCTIGGTLTVTAPVTIAPTLGDVFQVTLPNGNALLEYRGTIVCDVVNTDATSVAFCELYLESSTDASHWVEVGSNSHDVGEAAGRQVRLDVALTVGGNFGVQTGLPVTLRAKIGASSGSLKISSPVTPGGDLNSRGTVLLQLEECL